MKKYLIILSLLFAFSVNATTIIPLPEDKGFFERIFDKISYCKLDVGCYFEKQLGATVTTIEGSDTLKDSRSVINTNFANLNSDKIETDVTTLPLIETLAGLTSATSLEEVGTLTTGTWNANAIGVAYGGTGTTSPSQYLVMLGNGSNGLTVASSTGTAGKFLTSNGAGDYPSWQSSTVNQSDDYDWTGTNGWSGASGFTGNVTIDDLISASSTIDQLRTAQTPSIGNDVVNKTYSDQNIAEYSSGTGTQNTSAGEQTIAHGLSTTPDRIKITAYHADNNNQAFSSSNGVYDGTTYSTVSLDVAGGAVTQVGTTYVSRLEDEGGASLTATSTLDGTNINLGWVLSGSMDAGVSYIWEAWIN